MKTVVLNILLALLLVMLGVTPTAAEQGATSWAPLLQISGYPHHVFSSDRRYFIHSEYAGRNRHRIRVFDLTTQRYVAQRVVQAEDLKLGFASGSTLYVLRISGGGTLGNQVLTFSLPRLAPGQTSAGKLLSATPDGQHATITTHSGRSQDAGWSTAIYRVQSDKLHLLQRVPTLAAFLSNDMIAQHTSFEEMPIGCDEPVYYSVGVLKEYPSGRPHLDYLMDISCYDQARRSLAFYAEAGEISVRDYDPGSDGYRDLYYDFKGRRELHVSSLHGEWLTSRLRDQFSIPQSFMSMLSAIPRSNNPYNTAVAEITSVAVSPDGTRYVLANTGDSYFLFGITASNEPIAPLESLASAPSARRR